ncbi:hypothetical protein C8J56DRAFT_1042180 [Mycena floridula]|nr:hypothetical protein C8J56DRAFT_1042180 [Mycena floridula]
MKRSASHSLPRSHHRSGKRARRSTSTRTILASMSDAKSEAYEGLKEKSKSKKDKKDKKAAKSESESVTFGTIVIIPCGVESNDEGSIVLPTPNCPR